MQLRRHQSISSALSKAGSIDLPFRTISPGATPASRENKERTHKIGRGNKETTPRSQRGVKLKLAVAWGKGSARTTFSVLGNRDIMLTLQSGSSWRPTSDLLLRTYFRPQVSGDMNTEQAQD